MVGLPCSAGQVAATRAAVHRWGLLQRRPGTAETLRRAG